MTDADELRQMLKSSDRLDRLKQLRAFCAAARTQSMSRAAEQLGLSQPSISLHIRALESALGVRLFERHGPRIQLSAEGLQLYELARPLVEGIDALPEVFEERRRALHRGEIAIAAGESTILYLLPEVIAEFRRRYPDIRIHLHNVTGRDGLAMLRAREVDLAVGSMLEVPADIDYRPLFDYAPALIMPLGHPLAGPEPVTLEAISPYGLILPPRRLTTWRLIDWIFQQHKVPYRVDMEVGGWEVIKRYVALGMGISIVTSICLSGQNRLAMKDLSAFFPSRSYGLVRYRPAPLSAAAARFVEVLNGFGQGAGSRAPG